MAAAQTNRASIRTKLVWTLSPNSFNSAPAELAKQLHDNQVDAVFTVFLNERTAQYQALRDALSRANSTEATPEGRVGFVFSLIGRRAFAFTETENLALNPGDTYDVEFVVSLESCLRREKPAGTTPLRIAVSSEDMLRKLHTGARVEFGYGEGELEIVSLDANSPNSFRCRARAVSAGTIRSGMDVSSEAIPRGLLPLLSIDEQALKTRCMNMADLLVLHGINSSADIEAIQKVLASGTPGSPKNDNGPQLLLRIDSSASLELLPSVASLIQGVFLNRSELGTSVHPHSLPVVQKELLARCNRGGQTVLVASDIFSSMKQNPNPTRAEVSDLANLVADGVDAVVVGREITEGPYARLAADYLRDSIASAESELSDGWDHVRLERVSDIDGLTHAALHTARHAKAKAIVCLTRKGYTAGRLSSMHAPIDIIAVTDSLPVMRRMQLMNSVRPVLLAEAGPTDQIFSRTKALLQEQLGFQKGDRAVFVSLQASPISERSSNLIAIEEF